MIINGQSQCCKRSVISRERKRERDREDLWRKLEALSLTNARKEGISLDYINHVVRGATHGASAMGCV